MQHEAFKKFNWLLIVMLAVTAVIFFSGTALSDDDDDDDLPIYEANQVVIKLDANANVTVDAINAEYGTETLNALLGSRGIYLLQIPPQLALDRRDDDDDDDDDPVEQLVDLMEDDPRLLYVEPNYFGTPPEYGGRNRIAWGGPDAAPYGNQYAGLMLKLTESHAVSRGAGTVVAVLDTAFQLDHPALRANLTTQRYDFVDDDPYPDGDFAPSDPVGNGPVDDVAGHGTHVAATVLLAAPDARIMPLRVLDETGRGNVFLVAEAVDFALRNGAHVINMSLGTTAESAILKAVIDDAIAQEIVVVAAAGNLAASEPMFPAATTDVIAVGAVDGAGQRAAFSNYGPWLDVAAPGESIYSAFPINGYAAWSGTSMATPFVAGQAALLRAALPDLDAAAIAHRISVTAQPLADELGAGLIDPLASLVADIPPAGECTCDDDCEEESAGAAECNDEDDDDDDDDDDSDQDITVHENGTQSLHAGRSIFVPLIHR